MSSSKKITQLNQLLVIYMKPIPHDLNVICPWRLQPLKLRQKQFDLHIETYMYCNFRNIPEKGGKGIISSLASYQPLCLHQSTHLGFSYDTHLSVRTFITEVGKMTSDLFSSSL